MAPGLVQVNGRMCALPIPQPQGCAVGGPPHPPLFTWVFVPPVWPLAFGQAVAEHVPFQIAALVAAIVAGSALEGLVLAVDPFMAFEVAQAAAGEAAARAAVRLLPCVRAQVSGQVHQLSRSVGTLRARERLLPVVCLHVALEVAGVVGGEGAKLAGVHDALAAAPLGAGTLQAALPQAGSQLQPALAAGQRCGAGLPTLLRVALHAQLLVARGAVVVAQRVCWDGNLPHQGVC